MSKTAVIFPGLGYYADRPLLYYASKLAVNAGYEIVKIDYPGCSRDLLKASKEELKEYSLSCVKEAIASLKKKSVSLGDDLLFISKSIGTAIAAACAAAYAGRVRHIYFTPLEQTFDHVYPGSGIAFNGTKDTWADWKKVSSLCKEKDIPLMTFEGANHSIETGNVTGDIGNLQKIMSVVEEYI